MLYNPQLIFKRKFLQDERFNSIALFNFMISLRKLKQIDSYTKSRLNCNGTSVSNLPPQGGDASEPDFKSTPRQTQAPPPPALIPSHQLADLIAPNRVHRAESPSSLSQMPSPRVWNSQPVAVEDFFFTRKYLCDDRCITISRGEKFNEES